LLARAILDVTDPDPLPPPHPFWTPELRVMPYVASMTRLETASCLLPENIRRHSREKKLVGRGSTIEPAKAGLRTWDWTSAIDQSGHCSAPQA
jgi:phosphoglycerate dehydrogenase-like enzyme